MKLTVLGGGGVRAPLFAASALRRAEASHLDELCLMDIDAGRLEIIAGLCREAAALLGSPVRISATTDADAALEGAGYIVTTIRVGKEPGRVLDERIALRRGVLGQETTGPGGFAMAMRSIPEVLRYAALAEKRAPQAWIFNFTNPAGLVTQALRQSGFDRTVGICDGANLAQHDVSRWLKVPPGEVRHEVFGLNHLSWTRHAWVGGTDVLPGLLANPEFCRWSNLKLFDYELIQLLGLYLNEYLYYFYYAERALEQILGDKQTRGEEVLALNEQLFAALRDPRTAADPLAKLRTFVAYQKRRSLTYMHYAQPDGPTMDAADQVDFHSLAFDPEEGEGYAGVALDIISALEAGKPIHTALNVPNQGAIEGMQADDVVEVSCTVKDGKILPLPVGQIPSHAARLMQSVKEYERLAVDAILQRSWSTGVRALMAHPLVLSYTRASMLLGDYLEAHAEYIGEWK